MRLLLAPLAFALVLAGCLDAQRPALDTALADPPVEVSALAHAGRAQTEALGWSGEARLVGILATEGEPIGDNVDPPLFWNTVGDPVVGNGKAVVWTYAYAGPENGVLYYVSVGADGAVLYARELPLPYYWTMNERAHPASDGACCAKSMPAEPPAQPALALPALDSDAAIAVADSDEAFRTFGEAHPRHQVQIVLGGDGGNAVWAFVKRTATYFGASAAVDGASGALLHSASWPQPPGPCDACPPPPPPVPPRPADHAEAWSGVLPGRVSSGGYADGRATTSFPVESAHWFRAATVHVELDTLPNEYARLRLVDPLGQVVWETGGSSVLDAVVPWGIEGEYTVELIGDGATLRDVPFEASIAVVYGEPGWTEVLTQAGVLAPWAPAFEMPFSVGAQARELKLAVAFGDAVPTDGVRYRLEGPGYDEVVEMSPVEAFDVVLDSPAEGAWRLTFWSQPQTVKPLEVSVVAQLRYEHVDCCWM